MFYIQIEKLLHLTDNTYTETDVLKMEVVILDELNFKVHMPTPIDFLDRFLFCVPDSEVLESEAKRVSIEDDHTLPANVGERAET